MTVDDDEHFVWDPLDGALIGAGKADAPPAGSRLALERALGLVPPMNSPPAAEPPDAAFAPPVPPGALAPTSAGSLWTLKRLAAIGAIGASGLIAAIQLQPVTVPEGSGAHSRGKSSTARPQAPPPAAVLAPVQSGPSPPATVTTASSQRAVDAAPSVQRSRKPAPMLAASTQQPTTLAMEVELIERARRALAQNDPATALNELAAHGRLARPRALDAEADLVRVKALVHGGRREQAEQVADRLQRTHPGDAAARRAAEVLRPFPK